MVLRYPHRKKRGVEKPLTFQPHRKKVNGFTTLGGCADGPMDATTHPDEPNPNHSADSSPGQRRWTERSTNTPGPTQRNHTPVWSVSNPARDRSLSAVVLREDEGFTLFSDSWAACSGRYFAPPEHRLRPETGILLGQNAAFAAGFRARAFDALRHEKFCKAPRDGGEPFKSRTLDRYEVDR
ncbi:hypothetical protein [Rhodoplanes azumiensis]|uniref:Uncharacterized protein n=1 Tax=Rhodoplanes azumiensis TaxID=1897628 RepID=A0ABW5AJ45_9BRAD